MCIILFVFFVLLLPVDSIKVQATESTCAALDISAIISAVYTPFKTNGDLNLDCIPGYAQYLKENGILDILIVGYVGEASSMNLCDRTALIRAWVDAALPLGIGVIVQVTLGLPITNTLILAELCVELNVKAISVIPETVYTPQTIEEAIADIQLIAKVAIGIPILYQDIRVIDSVVSAVDIVLASRQISCFAGVITSFNTGLIIKAATPIADKLLIIIDGHDSISASIQLFSANVNSVTNYIPGLVLQIVTAVRAGDLASANSLQVKVNLITASVIGEGNLLTRVKARTFIVNQKVALALVTGLKIAIPRLPLVPATLELINKIANALTTLGVPSEVLWNRLFKLYVKLVENYRIRSMSNQRANAHCVGQVSDIIKYYLYFVEQGECGNLILQFNERIIESNM